MDIKQLEAEMHRFVKAKGWYAPNSPKAQTPRNLAISLAIVVAVAILSALYPALIAMKVTPVEAMATDD